MHHSVTEGILELNYLHDTIHALIINDDYLKHLVDRPIHRIIINNLECSRLIIEYTMYTKDIFISNGKITGNITIDSKCTFIHLQYSNISILNLLSYSIAHVNLVKSHIECLYAHNLSRLMMEYSTISLAQVGFIESIITLKGTSKINTLYGYVVNSYHKDLVNSNFLDMLIGGDRLYGNGTNDLSKLNKIVYGYIL